MSAKTIALYQAHTGRRTSQSERLRAHAERIRLRAASLLAQANELDEQAAELEPSCEGHETTNGPIGGTSYCDGSCQRGRLRRLEGDGR